MSVPEIQNVATCYQSVWQSFAAPSSFIAYVYVCVRLYRVHSILYDGLYVCVCESDSVYV